MAAEKGIPIGTKVFDVQGWADVRRRNMILKNGVHFTPLVGQFTRADGSTDLKEYDKALWKVNGYKVKFTMIVLDALGCRKPEESGPFEIVLSTLKVTNGAEISREGWVDVERRDLEVEDGTRYNDVTGLYVSRTGASNIANYDHYLQHLQGYKMQVTLEVIDIPENRQPDERIPGYHEEIIKRSKSNLSLDRQTVPHGGF